MFSLKARKDGFRLLLPKEFICPEIEEKYTKILRAKNGYLMTPIDFLNETIQKVQVFGIQNGTIQQQQPNRGKGAMIKFDRDQQNQFAFPATDYNYRSEVSPISLVDRTLNIEFRHTLGFLNYFLIFENFWYQFTRDRSYDEMLYSINIDIFNEKGSIYSRVVLDSPIINGIDMLDFDYTQPIATSETFKVELKYSNFDFQFLEFDDSEKSMVTAEETH